MSLSILFPPFISFIIFPSCPVNTYLKYVNLIMFPMCNALCQVVDIDLIPNFKQFIVQRGIKAIIFCYARCYNKLVWVILPLTHSLSSLPSLTHTNIHTNTHVPTICLQPVRSSRCSNLVQVLNKLNNYIKSANSKEHKDIT